jgi:hypothetical protein
VALAPLAPLEAAKQNKRKKHRNHRSKELLGARDIQKKAAQYSHELLSKLPPGSLAVCPSQKERTLTLRFKRMSVI